MNFIEIANAYNERESLRQRRIPRGLFRKTRDTERIHLPRKNFGKRKKKGGKAHAGGQGENFGEKSIMEQSGEKAGPQAKSPP